jgi:ubiquinone/menaquinone biosynthesis C-methylase UbiE
MSSEATAMTATPHRATSPSPAQAYEDYFGPAMFAPLAQVTLRHAAIDSGERVLDLACGTGIVARGAARLVAPTGAVVGVDINPGMLAEAQVQAQQAGVDITWRAADAAVTGLGTGTFDAVVCQQGLQFFGDREAGVREMHRVLREGGRAVIATWQGMDRHELFSAMAEVELAHLAALGAGFSRDDLERPFSLGDPAQLRRLCEAAGFGDVSVVEESIEARFATPERFVERMDLAYAAVVPALAEDPAVFAEFAGKVAADTQHIVARHTRDDHVVIPMHANVAIARR